MIRTIIDEKQMGILREIHQGGSKLKDMIYQLNDTCTTDSYSRRDEDERSNTEKEA